MSEQTDTFEAAKLAAEDARRVLLERAASLKAELVEIKTLLGRKPREPKAPKEKKTRKPKLGIEAREQA